MDKIGKYFFYSSVFSGGSIVEKLKPSLLSNLLYISMYQYMYTTTCMCDMTQSISFNCKTLLRLRIVTDYKVYFKFSLPIGCLIFNQSMFSGKSPLQLN